MSKESIGPVQDFRRLGLIGSKTVSSPAPYSPSETALSVVRIIIGLVLTAGGVFKLLNLSFVAELIEPNGWPLAAVSATIAGTLSLVGGLSLVLGFYQRVGAWFLLILFLLPVTIGFHGMADAEHLFKVWGMNPGEQAEAFAKAVSYTDRLNRMHVVKNLFFGVILLLIGLGGGQRWRR